MTQKDAYYFSHDSNARNDEKILAVRMRFGAEGYGIYFMIIERLRESSNYMSVKDYNMIAFDLRVGAEKVKSIVEDFELFDFADDGRKFYSTSLINRMDKKETISQKRTEAANKRWSKSVGNQKDNANAMQMQCKGDALKEKKGKEKKEKENKIGDEVQLTYEEFKKMKPKFRFGDEKLRKKWEEWKSFTAAEFGKTYKTLFAEEAAMNDLDRLSNQNESYAIAIIQQSIEKHWKSLYQIKDFKDPNSEQTYDPERNLSKQEQNRLKALERFNKSLGKDSTK